MTGAIDISALERAILCLPQQFKGPGGAVGVVECGKIVARQAWGYANLATGLAMTTATRMPICSITKQFTCAVLLDLIGDPHLLDARLADYLPHLEGHPPGVVDLCNMQSGLRDYWALTVLHGAHPEGVFPREAAKPLLASARTTHFEPGKSYSYSNGNFRILADLLEEYAGRSLAELYVQRIFDRAGMQTALLTADTSTPLDGVLGYEGNDRVGFFPATNRIHWEGDAGISASLDDMLAWEIYIDATRDDPDGLYRRLSEKQTFSDGKPAPYGYGLVHGHVGDLATTGHAGGLRGFRLQRFHVASRRLSVVVFFNHEASANEAALTLLRAGLGIEDEPRQAYPLDPDWNGSYLDQSNGLLLDIHASGEGVEARYATSPERLFPGPGGMLVSPSMTLARAGDTVRLERPRENLVATANRVTGDSVQDLPGRYFSPDLAAFLHIDMAGTCLFGCFEGLHGRGPMHAIYPAGKDVFVLPCQRSMDAPAPGRWTIQVNRNDAGQICGLTVGCWLARNIPYRKVD